MRTRNEKILLIILVAIAFIGGNLFGYRWLATKQAALTLSEKTMRADKAEAEVNLQQADMWTQRKTWVKAHEPAMGDEGETKAQVLEHVLKGARDNKLEIQEQNLGESAKTTAGTRINVSVKIKGSMENLVKWLTGLEKPEDFYAITDFSLKADQDQKSFICSLKVARYFTEGKP